MYLNYDLGTTLLEPHITYISKHCIILFVQLNQYLQMTTD